MLRQVLKYKIIKLKLILGRLFVVSMLTSSLFLFTGVARPVYAAVNNTINYQSKIVIKSSGLNLTTGTPACVKSGADTCDFQVRIWNDISASSTTSGTGNLLFTQTFQDVEIGDNNGIFNLSINSCGSTVSGTSQWGTSTGTCTVVDDGGDADSDPGVNFNRADLFIEISFAPTDTSGSLGSFSEVFTRTALKSVPSAIYAANAASLSGLTTSDLVQFATGTSQTTSGSNGLVDLTTTGTVSNALVKINENGSGTPDLLDLQVASSSKFKVANTGQITTPYFTANKGVLYADSSGNISQTSAPGASQCLQTDGRTNFTWGSCGGSGGVNFAAGTTQTTTSTNSLIDITSTATAATNSMVIVNENGTGTPALLDLQVASSSRLKFTNAGQLQLAVQGNTGGLLIGGDAVLYRSGSNALTAGALTTTAGLTAGTALTLSTGQFTLSGSSFMTMSSTNTSNLISVTSTATSATSALLKLNENGTGAPNLFQMQVSSSDVAVLSNAGQLQLPIQGGTGGVLIGGDTQIYRNAADQLRTPDSWIVDVNGSFGTTTNTAFGNFAAPTTAKASLRLLASSTVNPTTPNSGDIWWNGSNLFFYNGSANVDLLANSLFVDGGTFTYLTSTTDDLILGATTVGASALFLGHDGSAIFNNQSAAVDFNVKGDTDASLLYVKGSTDRVGIGTNNPQAKLEIAGGTSSITNASGDITITAASSLVLGPAVYINGNLGVGSAPISTSAAYVSKTFAMTSPTSYTGVNVFATGTGANASGGISGLTANAYVQPGTSNTDLLAVGVIGSAVLNSAGTLQNARGTYGIANNISTGTITTAASLFADSVINSGGGTVTSAYGLVVASQNVGSQDNIGVFISGASGGSGSNYAIYVASGDTNLQGKLYSNSLTSNNAYTNTAGDTTATVTVTNNAFVFDLQKSTGTTNTATTTTYNLTGVNNVNGSVLFIHTKVAKGATSTARVETIIVQINGTQISTVATSSTTSAATVIEDYTAVRSNGTWFIHGLSAAETADVAEYIPGQADLQAGEILAIDQTQDEAVVRSTSAYQKSVLGVYSTQPYLINSTDKGNIPLALAGRVPVFVSNINGDISRGDAVTSSTIPGYGMKATKSGQIVGRALENSTYVLSNDSCPADFRSQVDTHGDPVKCGTILVFLQVGYDDQPDLLESPASGLNGISAADAGYFKLLSDNQTIGTDYNIQSAGSISALSFKALSSNDLALQMSDTGVFSVLDMNGTKVLGINSAGKLSLLESSNSSTGKVILPAGSMEVQVNNGSVTANSRITITADQFVQYRIKSKTAGVGFIIEISTEIETDTNFDYLIIN